MGDIRLFHVIDDSAHELENNPFPYERGLQKLFEKHLRALTGIDFLDSEYSTGKRHSRRIDTLGIDEAGRPVVIEYKRSRDENVINQGLDYLDWLDDHQAEFSELVRKKLGEGRRADFRTPRLLCIASEFPRRDTVAARDSRRRIELLRYRRYGDAYMALEWVFGDEDISPGPRSVSRPADRKAMPTPAPQPTVSSPSRAEEDPDYSIYPPWNKTSEETRTLFRELETMVESLGKVRTDAFKSEMSFKCLAAPSNSEPVVAYVKLRIHDGLRLLIYETHVRDIPLEDGFTRPYDRGRMREIAIRNEEHIRKAEPLLRAAYDSLSEHGGSPVRSAAARKAWTTRRGGTGVG
jgi:hypothetical protein